ncbi:MAG: hypothetical protein H6737_07175 [Alphaproteobacteria bacterium]|nr:hypothetical protein [Alphaproteobacteria bacterium]
MLLLLASALAQVVSTGPFTGDMAAGFEGMPLSGTPPQCVDTALGDLCAYDATVGGIQVRDELFLGCLLSARTGTRMAGSNDGGAHIVFATPVTRFGGYMATHANDGDVTIEVYGTGDQLLGAITEALGGSCNWAWHGVSASGALISRVRILHSEHGGALVDLDDLVAESVCGPNAPDGDGDGVPTCADCNDADAGMFPGAIDDCDGVDDDCNGVVDDSPPGAGLASVQAGVCAGATQVCGPAGLVDPDYALIPGYEAVEVSCDGLDNDCDGQTDAIDDPPVVSEVGICATIPRICDGANGWVDPLPEDVQGWQERENACDGIDNDCDGQVDEDVVPPPSSFAVGVCSDLVKVCAGVDRWQEPEDLPPEFGAEICNGLDDDCDGVVDDDCTEPSLLSKCGCRSGGPASGLVALLAVLALRRRR